MRRFLSFWWLCVRNAFPGSYAFANNWQWMFGIPICSSVVAGLASARGVTKLTTGNPILDAFLAGLGAFLVTWAIAFTSRLGNAPVVLFYEQKDSADAAIAELAEKTAPKFQLSFDQERSGIVFARDAVAFQDMGAHGVRNLVRYVNVKYIRICATALSKVTVRNCQAFLVALEKRENEHEVFIYISLPQPIPLKNGARFDILPNIPQMIDFMKTSEEGAVLAPIDPWPIALAGAFKGLGTYRFTIAVNGDGVTQQIQVKVFWRGEWDTITGEKDHPSQIA